MAATDPTRTSDARLLAYRFAGVVVDLRRETLRVDDDDVTCTPQMLKLLRLLCAADGQVVRRQDVFDALWPGGQQVSDSSLSQLVWRLRGALGAYGELISTVRGSGLRLDAAVSSEFDFHRPTKKAAASTDAEARPAVHLVDALAREPMPAPPMPSRARAPAVEAPSARKRSRVPIAAALIVAAVVLAGAGFAARSYFAPADVVVSAGYALTARDLQATRADTASIVAAALAADDTGERSRASALMRSVHESDPGTPVPAIFLARWNPDGDESDAQTWITAARQRMNGSSSPYVRLLADYVAARASGESVRGPLNAALDLRPQASFLQYASAHDQLAHRETAGALRALERIDPHGLEGEIAAEVVADRVSLGDGAAAALADELSAIHANTVLSAYTQGRIAYSRGELDSAVALFEQCRLRATDQREYAMQEMAAVLAALAATEAGRPDAAAYIDTAKRVCNEQSDLDCEVEMLGFEAFVSARAGNAAAANAALAEAWRRNRRSFIAPPLLLVAMENGLDAPGNVAAVAQAQAGNPVFGGVSDLLLAWDAFVHANPTLARERLATARVHGVAGTYHAEDANLLAARLGESAAACRMDPPYPNRLRLTACVSAARPAR